jgi:hypothetical protein
MMAYELFPPSYQPRERGTDCLFPQFTEEETEVRVFKQLAPRSIASERKRQN